MFRTFRLLFCVPLSLSLGLSVACGASDDSGSDGTSGSSSAGTSSAGTSSGGSGGSSSNSGGGTTNGPAGGDFSSDLPGNKPLSDLTENEAMELCQDLGEFFEDEVADKLSDFSCRASGLLAALLAEAETDEQARSACQVAYDGCAAEPVEPSDERCTKPAESCTATVGELEACMNDLGPYLSAALQGFPSCNELTLDDLMEVGQGVEPTPPASCETYEEKCSDGPNAPSLEP